MAEIDTSSYPKPTAPASPLDIAGKLGGLQSQALQINQQKLSQANEALTYLTRAMTAIGPDGSKDQYKRAGADAVNAGLAPPNMLGIWNKKIDDAPTPRSFWNEATSQIAQHSEAIGFHLGQVRPTDTNQGTRYDQIPGKGGPGTPRAFIPKDIPPTERIMGPDNTPTLQGNQPQLSAPGIDQPISRRLPVAPPLPPGPMNPAMVPGMRPGERATAAEVMPATTPSGPNGPAVGLPFGSEEGMKQRTADQDLAAQKMTAIKPLLLAYPKILDLRSGPGTASWNSAVAFLKANNIIPTQINESDPTAVYQEANKYFNQYISRNGSRSDAEQSAKEMSNPDIKTHINPALVELTRKTVAQDRIEAMRPNAFNRIETDKNGKDIIVPETNMSKYGTHKSQFPQSMNVEAAHFDMLPNKERLDKYKAMRSAAEKGNKNAIQFLRTLDEARRQNMHDFSLMP